MTGRPTRVVVVGADAPLWLSALTIHGALHKAGVTVEAVALPSRADPAEVVEARPAIEALHNRLGIREDRLLAAAKGAFMLGRRLAGDPADGPGAFVGYGANGAAFGQEAFLPHWLRARDAGFDAPLEAFNLVASAALQGRRLVPDAEIAAFARADYGYALPARAYARSLAALAGQDGLTTHQTDGLGVDRGEDGRVTALRLDDGRSIAGDLFVDVSRDAVVSEGALQSPTEDWSLLFPTARIVRATAPPLSAAPAYSRVEAYPWGWLARIPTPAATHLLAVFSEDGDAARELDRMGFGSASSEGLVRFGRTAPWRFNCVAIGPAACRLDPIFGLDLHALQLGLIHFVSRFPTSADAALERDDYNGALSALLENLRDFQIAHYRAQRYRGRVWDEARAGGVPPALAHRLALFAARGLLGPLEHETIPADEWQSLLIGHGLRPASHDPMADINPSEAVLGDLRGMLDFIARKVSAFPMNAVPPARTPTSDRP
ncbi:MAG: tryptophan halogenase [Brevundimonas sp.]|nr:MAG: tryptophan halogenase [Brevundimonas sp.]